MLSFRLTSDNTIAVLGIQPGTVYEELVGEIVEREDRGERYWHFCCFPDKVLNAGQCCRLSEKLADLNGREKETSPELLQPVPGCTAAWGPRQMISLDKQLRSSRLVIAPLVNQIGAELAGRLLVYSDGSVELLSLPVGPGPDDTQRDGKTLIGALQIAVYGPDAGAKLETTAPARN